MLIARDLIIYCNSFQTIWSQKSLHAFKNSLESQRHFLCDIYLPVFSHIGNKNRENLNIYKFI